MNTKPQVILLVRTLHVPQLFSDVLLGPFPPLYTKNSLKDVFNEG